MAGLTKMMGRTHWVIGGASWLGVLAFCNSAGTLPLTPVEVFGGFAIAAVSALEPDIDTKNSMASKMLGPVTKLASYLVRTLFGGHRKITHSLLGFAIAALITLGVVQATRIPGWIGAAVLVGWISHVLADMTTREGCPLLWPVSKMKFGLHIVETGKRLERYLIRPGAIVSCVVFGILLAAGML